jgi:hypothetical protein
MISFDEWFDAVKEYCIEKHYDLNHFEYFYSFRIAHTEGMKPNEAVEDCQKWLEV